MTAGAGRLRLGRPGVKRALAGGLVGAAALVAAVLALRDVLPPGYDFFHFYHPTVQAWLAGQTLLYDELTAGFYSPPWTVWLLAPFGLLDLRTGMAALTVVTAAAIAGVALWHARAVGAPRPALLAALTTLSPYTLQVLFVGSLDGLSLLGLYAAYRAAASRRPVAFGAALMLAAIRPQNLVLTGPALVVLAVRGWLDGGMRAREGVVMAGRALLAPGLVLGACAVAFGVDWPLRWWQAWREYPPIPYLVTSTYAATNLAGIPLWLVAGGMAVLALRVLWRAWRGMAGSVELAVAANAAMAPYMLSQSYALLLALPWMLVMRQRPWVGAALYALSLPLLARAAGLWDRLGLLDVCFPLLMVVVLLWRCGRAEVGRSATLER